MYRKFNKVMFGKCKKRHSRGTFIHVDKGKKTGKSAPADISPKDQGNFDTMTDWQWPNYEILTQYCLLSQFCSDFAENLPVGEISSLPSNFFTLSR